MVFFGGDVGGDSGTEMPAGGGWINRFLNENVGKRMFDEGGGDSNSYRISTVDQLQAINTELDANYELANTIEASETSTWNNGAGFQPLGDERTPFTGTFDGNGYVIKDLTIDRAGENGVGVFGKTEDATVENVRVESIDVVGGNKVGGLIGDFGTGGSVRRSATTGRVSGSEYVGGLIGKVRGTVQECSSDCFVDGSVRVGGLVGGNQVGSMIQKSYATGGVTGTEAVGGLFGGNQVATDISESYAIGSVSAETDVGGLVGRVNNSGIRSSYWDITTTTQGDSADSTYGRADRYDGLSTDEMTGTAAKTHMDGFDFQHTWHITDSYPILVWQKSWKKADSGRRSETIDSLPTDRVFRSRVQDATTVATVTIDGNDYLVLREIPDEPTDRFAYVDDQYRLLEPVIASNVAISYTYCDAYAIDNTRRFEYTINQYEEFGDLESMARVANLMSDLSGAVALAKLSPVSATSHAVDALQTVVEWGEHELNDPYHEQFAKIATASSTVEWADNRLPHPGSALVNPADDVLEVTETMVKAAEAARAVNDVAETVSAVREIVRQADSIRDNVPLEEVDGAEDLFPTANTLLFGLAVDTTVDSVSTVAEGQAKTAAIGKGQAAARLPLLNELRELEARANNYNLGPAGVLRIQTLHQTDYQIEAAALYSQAKIIENFQSSRLGSIVATVNGTDELPSSLRSSAETYRDLSHFQFAATGELFEQALEAHRNSMNAEEYGDQHLFDYR